mgnify:FL=1
MKKIKKSTGLTLALLIYVSATAAYFLPRNTEISDTEKYVTVAASYLIVFVLWLVLRKKEALQRKRFEEDNKQHYLLKKQNKMKKLALFVCLLVVTVAAQAQFEKGKWILNPSITGLEFSHDTGTDKTSFGLEAKGGAFLLDNIALLVHAGAAWNTGGSDLDVYTLGVGGRYYFDKIGVYLGADVNVDRWDWGHDLDDTKFSFGLEAGYAFFLTRTVTIEPAAYWNVNSDRSKFGLKVGFGFYF